MKKPELLAPAGSMDSLKAAIAAGCDAVYLSGKMYGARAFANNFSNEELEEAINLCHLYGIKVYITINTLIYDSEVDLLLEYVEFIHKLGVDAVIMQDLGMIDLVRKTYPNLEIHASTQAHIHNLEGTKLMEELGLSRVVLARETPIELIKEIKDNTNIELEIFIHGALCISYSGQCLMSSLIGGRSGNRGSCAQCCRQPYDLVKDGKKINKDKYLLSTKDLNTIFNIDKLIDIGVDSLKIEGRMKRPEYVYMVVSLYRRAIDSYINKGIIDINENDIKELKKIFNRKFTKGFIFHEVNDNFTNNYRPNHMGIEIGKVIDYKNNKITIKLNDYLNIGDGIRILDSDIGFNVTTMYKNNNKVNHSIKGDIINIPIKDKVSINSIIVKTTDIEQLSNINSLINNMRKIPINMDLYIRENQPIKLVISDNKNNIEVYSDNIIEKAINSPTTKEDIIKQMSKLGNTIYSLNKINIDCDNNLFIPVKVLNDLRRKGVELLNSKRLIKKEVIKGRYSINVPDFDVVNKKCILISNIKDYEESDIVYVDNIDLHKKIDNSILKLDRVLEHLPEYNEKLLVGELGSVYKYKNVDTDFSLNVTNSYTVAYLHSLGVDKVTLSYELNDKQIKELIDNYHKRYQKHPNLELIISGYEEVMVSKYKLSDNSYLLDRFNNKYRIKINNNLMHIYNYKKRDMLGDYYKMGINYIRINKD